MSASRGKTDVELFVLSGREAPELKELVQLPSRMHLLSTGRPDMELKGTRFICVKLRLPAVVSGMTARRLVKIGLGEGPSTFEMRYGQRRLQQAGTAGDWLTVSGQSVVNVLNRCWNRHYALLYRTFGLT